jgi:hypothetical protein
MRPIHSPGYPVTRPLAALGRLALLASLALASCTTSMQTWRDPDYRPEPVKRVFVVADGPDQEYREVVENAVARRLLAAGYESATAYGVGNPGRFDVDKVDPALTQELATIGKYPTGTNIDAGKVLAYARTAGVDLAVVLRVARSNCETYAIPGCMTVQARVFAVRTGSEAPVWADVLTAGDFNTIADGAAAIADRLVGDLTKARVLVR